MGKTSKEKFGNYIRRIREEKQMSREELAEALYVTVDAVCKWETGKRYPDFDRVTDLADTLGVTVQDIFENSS